jgi:PST family polysaccharide transporter
MRLIKNILSLGLVNTLAYLFPLLQAPMLINRLGLAQYSVVVEGFAIVLLGYVVCNFAADLFGVEKISKNREIKRICKFYILSITTIRITLSFFYCFFAYLYLEMKSVDITSNIDILKFFLLIVIAQSIYPLWVARGLELIRAISISSISVRALNLLLIFLFVQNQVDLWLIPIIYLFTSTIATFWLFYSFPTTTKQPVIINIRRVRVLISKVIPYFLARLAVGSYNALPVLILSNYTSAELTSIYGVLDQYYRAIKQIYLSISTAMFPYMAKVKDIKLYKKVLKWNSFLLFVVVVLALFTMPYFLSILFSEEIGNAVYVSYSFLFLFVVSVNSSILGYPLFTIFNKASIVNSTSFIGFYVFVFGSILLIFWDCVSVFTVMSLIIISELLVMFLRAVRGMEYAKN